MYTPIFWSVLKISGASPHYKLFATWHSGADVEWRMNSGIVEVEDDGDYLNFIGHSGSVYHCHKDNYGITDYGSFVLDSYIKRLPGKIELLENQDWFDMDWIITKL